MKAKINNVVELSSLDKIDKRQSLFNQSFIVSGFSMCTWSSFLLIDSKELFFMFDN